MKNISEKILKYRQVIIIITIILTVFFSFFIPKLKINPDVISFLPDDDPVTQVFDSIGDAYGGNMIALIGYKTNDVFTYNSLNEIKQITDTIKTVPGVSTITSIINIIDVRNQDSMLQVVPLIDEYNIPSSPEVLDSLKNYVLQKDIYKGSFVSEDATAALINFKIQPKFKVAVDTSLSKDTIIEYYQNQYPSPIYKITFSEKFDSVFVDVDKTVVSELVRNKLSALKLNGTLYFGGLPYMISDISSIISHDIIVLGILAFLIILIILYISFKTWRGVILPVLTVSIAIVWIMGIMAIIGLEITMVTNVTPVILLATGSAYTIHVVNRIQQDSVQFPNKPLKSLISEALAYIAIPVFFAAATTMVGFVSFIFGSYLVMISQFGLLTALGVLFSFILSVTFAPAFLSYFPFRNLHIKKSTNTKSDFIDKITSSFSFINEKRKISAIVFWIIIIVIFSFGIFKIERRVDLLDYFKENYSSKKTEKFLREKFGGTSYLFVNFKGDIQNIDNLKLINTIQEHIDSLPQIDKSLSVINILKEMNDVMGEGKKLPDTQEKIYNLWFLMEGQETISQILTSDNQQSLIQATLKTSDSKTLSDLVDYLNSYFDKLNIKNLSVEISGFPSIYKKIDESLINSQLYSLAIAIILVYFLVSYLLRSLKNGLLAIIPIVTTVIVLFGTMGWLHIPLDVATVLVASVTMGIGIDYAIHFISHFMHDQKNGKSIIDSVRSSTQISGRAIIINVLSVTLGFIVLIFSDLVPLQRFGMLIGVTMITSGLSTLTLLAAILNLKHKNN